VIISLLGSPLQLCMGKIEASCHYLILFDQYGSDMKILITYIALFFTLKSACLFADDVPKPELGEKSTWEDRQKVCNLVSELAPFIMTQRQEGVPMVDLMSIFGKEKIMRSAVVFAYTKPQLSDAKDKALAIKEFTDLMVLTCFKGIAEEHFEN
jgi:hypothetical protein